MAGEWTTKLMENKNTLVFIEQRGSNNSDIERTFKQRFEADIRRVHTLVRPDGRNKQSWYWRVAKRQTNFDKN